MAQPVLVRAYAGNASVTGRSRGSAIDGAFALPPVASYAFADIFRSADSPELQTAIDGIAEICAKNRMSLADEYSSHLPPLGVITSDASTAIRPHMLRPGGGMRTALTSVPEASSGSSEGSRKSGKKRGGIFRFRRQPGQDARPMRRMRIGSMGRTVPVGTTTAVTAEAWAVPEHSRCSSEGPVIAVGSVRSLSRQRTVSAAQLSLQRLLAGNQTSPED